MFWTIIGLVQLYIQYSSAGCTASAITGAKILAGSKSPRGYNNDDVLMYGCDTGYVQTAGATNTTCTTSGWEWAAPAGSAIVCTKTCPHPASSALGTQLVSGSADVFLSEDTVVLSCANGFYQASGGTSAICSSTGAWSWGSAGALTCNPLCAVPQANNAHVTSTNMTTFTDGVEVTLSCLTGYVQSGGSATVTCSSDGTWSWTSQGIIQCSRQCPALQLTTGSALAIGAAPYAEGDTVTLNCLDNYIVGGGSGEGLCHSTGQWLWGEDGQLRCLATCPSPTTGNNAIMLSTAKSQYVEGDEIELGCLNGYVYSSGGSVGLCSALHQWQWAGASAPLGCIIAPKYKGSTSATFKPTTCSHYVSRMAQTSSTCLLSCLYDDYCEGYAFTNGTCFMDRPLLEPRTASIDCVQRSS